MAFEFAGYGLDLNHPTLFRRCLVCPNTSPACPSCAADETCAMSSQSCLQCASTSCVSIGTGSSSSSSSSSKKSTPAGAIAGGVIGGVIFIMALTYLVWRFCIRNKRRAFDEQERAWSESASEKRSTFGASRSARQSTRSIASTVLTRASNVIQIAYIPGVTNRSPPDTPALLVPPVPPLPVASASTSNASTPRFTEDQHFFLPSDLARDSTWSGFTDENRQSLSPSLARSSVATTIYGQNAVVSPVAAQQALRGKAAVVSVKSGATTPNPNDASTSTPPVPSIDTSKFNNSPFVARTMVAKPINVTRSNSSKTGAPAKSLKSSNSNASQPKKIAEDNSGFDDTSSEESDDGMEWQGRQQSTAKKSGHKSGVTVIEDSPAVKQSPFVDTHKVMDSGSSSAINPEGRRSVDGSSAASHRHSKSGSLNIMLDNGRRGSNGQSSNGREASPFSDDHELK